MFANNRMTETDNSETRGPLKAYRGNTDSEFETRTLMQEEAVVQTKTYIDPSTEQLGDWTRLIQEILSFHRQKIPEWQVTVLILTELVSRPTLDVFMKCLILVWLINDAGS